MLTTLAALAAAVGSKRYRWALACYFAFGALSVICQLAVVLVIFASPERVASSILSSEGGGLAHAIDSARKAGSGALTPERLAQLQQLERNARETLAGRLDAVKWCFLLLALAEGVGLGAAAWRYVRSEVPWSARYEGLEAGEAARLRGVELRDALRQGLGGGSGGGRSNGASSSSSSSSSSAARFVSGVSQKNNGFASGA